jgi:glutamate synthase (ferredoxin)
VLLVNVQPLLQEGWDGPALLVFSDGVKVGARLDRNGLRPARFWRTRDGVVFVASEVGVLNDVMDSAPSVVAKGRLGPGQMIVADLGAGTFKEQREVAKEVATSAPYAAFLASSVHLYDLAGKNTHVEECTMDAGEALRLQAAMGYGLEDTQMVIEGMAQGAVEPTYCMGDDNPLAVLSDKPHMIFTYFKQRFAQVTNPPIDPLREGLVMSLNMRLGARGNLLQPAVDSYRQIMLDSPVLLEAELDAIKKQDIVKAVVRICPASVALCPQGTRGCSQCVATRQPGLLNIPRAHPKYNWCPGTVYWE